MTTKEAASNTIYSLGSKQGGSRQVDGDDGHPGPPGSDRVFFEVDSGESVLVNPFTSDVMPESLSGVRRKRATDLKRGGHAYVATSPELRANP
jgi:hypothetical protein